MRHCFFLCVWGGGGRRFHDPPFSRTPLDSFFRAIRAPRATEATSTSGSRLYRRKLTNETNRIS